VRVRARPATPVDRVVVVVVVVVVAPARVAHARTTARMACRILPFPFAARSSPFSRERQQTIESR
jgi:hypothetical protein